ncbi:MAG: hypothetical protein KatS3mg050_1338 [Litorilinea sp.]|nr:MAG: hypothetical protein KatS3mg050_1338 [Litorilinea sp.]
MFRGMAYFFDEGFDLANLLHHPDGARPAEVLRCLQALLHALEPRDPERIPWPSPTVS